MTGFDPHLSGTVPSPFQCLRKFWSVAGDQPVASKKELYSSFDTVNLSKTREGIERVLECLRCGWSSHWYWTSTESGRLSPSMLWRATKE